MPAPLSLLLACLLLLALPSPGRAAPVVTAGSATVNVGDTFQIPISITGAEDLQSWQFDLAFDPAILSASSVTEGPFLSESGTKTTTFVPGVIDNETGQITLVADFFGEVPPGPSGAGVLAEIEFHALAPGVSPLTLSKVFLNLSDSGFEIENGQVTVLGPRAAVPEPAALVLVAVGLGAWAAWRRRPARRAPTR
jgi:general secretion pathway protein D